jgi:ribosomal protein S18 acetylase RimI-like enzyme
MAFEHQPHQVRRRHGAIVLAATAVVNDLDGLGALACVHVTIEIRPVRPGEHDEAGRVTALAYREFVPPDGSSDWDQYLAFMADIAQRAVRTTVLVAVEDGRILGSVTLELDGRTEPDDPPLASDQAHIRMLGVDPAARRRGVARALMDASIERARAAGKTRLTLHTTASMTIAQGMYDRMGFRRAPDIVFPDGFTLLGYERDL